MNYSDIKDLSKSELVKKQKSAAKDLFELKMKNSLGQLSNPMEIRVLRKNVAKIKTAMSQKLKG